MLCDIELYSMILHYILLYIILYYAILDYITLYYIVLALEGFGLFCEVKGSRFRVQVFFYGSPRVWGSFRGLGDLDV